MGMLRVIKAVGLCEKERSKVSASPVLGLGSYR